MKHKKVRIDFLDDVEYSFKLIISSFHLLGSARDDRLCEDELYSFNIALFHFIVPILEETKEHLYAYIKLLKEKEEKEERQKNE